MKSSQKNKCRDCQKSLPLDHFEQRADGSYRSKCRACMHGLNSPYLRKVNPAPNDLTPTPNIVREAQDYGIETFIGIARAEGYVSQKKQYQNECD